MRNDHDDHEYAPLFGGPQWKYRLTDRGRELHPLTNRPNPTGGGS